MKTLWAPWRMEYIRAPKPGSGDCILCGKVNSKDDKSDLVIYRGQTSFVMMNLFTYNNGHVMVVPYRHCSDFELLAAETQMEMMTLTSRCMTIMRHSMRAEGFNFGANFGQVAGAGIEEHLHFHIVPRWNGDTNFMPVLGHTKVQVDGLQETRDLLAAEFKK